jgi:hypothetical protein
MSRTGQPRTGSIARSPGSASFALIRPATDPVLAVRNRTHVPILDGLTRQMSGVRVPPRPRWSEAVRPLTIGSAHCSVMTSLPRAS